MNAGLCVKAQAAQAVSNVSISVGSEVHQVVGATHSAARASEVRQQAAQAVGCAGTSFDSSRSSQRVGLQWKWHLQHSVGLGSQARQQAAEAVGSTRDVGSDRRQGAKDSIGGRLCREQSRRSSEGQVFPGHDSGHRAVELG